MKTSVLLASILSFFVSVASADIANPVGLSPGDQYRIAYITQDTRNGTNSNISVYDTFVTNQANQAGSLTAQLNATWFSIASTYSIGPGTRTDAKITTGTDDSPLGENGVPIYLVDGVTRIADNYDDLWDGNIDNPINLNQFGNSRISAAFTGTAPDGTVFNLAELGDPDSGLSIAGLNVTNAGTTVNWVSDSSLPNLITLPFYGISSVQTVQVPEPNALLGVGLLSMLAWARRKRVG